MPSERRNLYRLLHVQPEAPPEIIKASYRTLMSTLRSHPDLGGDAQMAARINAAYELLSDPERRRAYDRTLQRPRQAAAVRVEQADPAAWRADGRCPYCRTPLPEALRAHTRCSTCASPLFPLPAAAGGELFGRRRSPRSARALPATLRWPAQGEDVPGRLRDLSVRGACVLSPLAVPRRTPLRIVTEGFDAVAVVVDCRRHGSAHTVHGELLTLELLRTSGVFVSARA